TEIARHVGMSHSTLARRFRVGLNSSIVDQINRRRIEEAKKMILAPDAKAYLIGTALGFSSPYYFYQVFRKLTGQTTRQFRARHLSNAPSQAVQMITPHLLS